MYSKSILMLITIFFFGISNVYALEGESELLRFYANYNNLKKCFEARKGYVLVHLNAIEMKSIKSNAKKIQTGIYKKYPALEAEQDRIWNDSVKTSLTKSPIVMAFMLGNPLIGSIEITNNFNEGFGATNALSGLAPSGWNEICNYIKTDYNSFIKKYGGSVEAPKKDF